MEHVLQVFVIVGFHMTSLKFKLQNYRYFHGVLEQLKINFQTNFRFKRVLGFVIEYAWISNGFDFYFDLFWMAWH